MFTPQTPPRRPKNTTETNLVNPHLFIQDGRGNFACTACPTGYESLRRALRHEDTARHVERVRLLDRRAPISSPLREHNPSHNTPSPESTSDIQSGNSSPAQSPHDSHNRPDPGDDSSVPTAQTQPGDLFGDLHSVHGPALPEDDADQIYDDFIGNHATQRYQTPPDDTDTEDNSASEEDDDEAPTTMPTTMPVTRVDVLRPNDERVAEEQRRLAPDICLEPSDDADWWPWKNKEASIVERDRECLLDVMGAFPRSLFSEAELKAARWYAAKHGVTGLPNVRQVKNHRKKILDAAGISTRTVEGKLGNLYAVNDWAQIIRNEFANPLVRPHISVYPEDSGDCLEETRQAARWKTEINTVFAGVMARGDADKDYFVEEPCFANLDDAGRVGPVMPMRWFTRKGQLYCEAYLLAVTAARDAFVIDARNGVIELPLSAFFLSVLDLEDELCQSRYCIPSPHRVLGILRDSDPRAALETWDRPPINPWRKIANGRRVHSVPLWFYCDDTSGNVSKKWNKHNSILFTLAGLERKHAQMLYNVQFVTTSNICAPLEMMESVTEMLSDAQKNGIEIWDCLHNEDALVIPWMLAFQGDNPMSSEIASHVGMKGKFFCRVCHAKGPDEKNRTPGKEGEVERIREFIEPGELRSKAETVRDLQEQLERVLGGAPSAVDGMATETGSKDKYFQHFISTFAAVTAALKEKQKGGTESTSDKAEELRRELRKLREQMPDNLFNPVLELFDFDPSIDTPVELLHVLLLGVVKYWWRDAVSRQTSKGKEELKTRLSSLNVDGISSSRLRGHTLVQYAGSLVGRDFRIVLQVAPAVLQGLIPQSHYDGWLALCRLAPLLFQPRINHLPTYLQTLQHAIDEFLIATALWNTQWFNKAKFHLFVHVPYHVRRYGPGILYATETFESYNLVIRLRSIHSTKHAPSKDIGQSFAHLHAVRHLVSGGYIICDDGDGKPTRRQAGIGVRRLMADAEFVQMMSMQGLWDQSQSGHYQALREDAVLAWEETVAGKSGVPNLLNGALQVLRCQSLVLTNEDLIQIHSYVLYRPSSSASTIQVGRVEEILVNSSIGTLIGVVITKCETGEPVLPYYFPRCFLREQRTQMLAFEDILCTISTIHNCAAHHCQITRTRPLIQERQTTLQHENEITHTIEPNDIVLNLAQMRSAEWTQVFQPPSRYNSPSRNFHIRQAVQNRIDMEKESQQAKVSKEIEKAEKAKAKAAKGKEKADKAKANELKKLEKTRKAQEREALQARADDDTGGNMVKTVKRSAAVAEMQASEGSSGTSAKRGKRRVEE
ncbi:hypothetical protein HWV62_19513 [Athelia sp. TMB]|nr:hypothetical protein HWV62_19513 [Athelia sp. TMB]